LTVGFYSYLFAFAAYFVLSLLLLISWRGRSFATLLVIAGASTCAWAAVSAFSVNPGSRTSWCLFLLIVLDRRVISAANLPAGQHSRWFSPLSGILAILFLAPPVAIAFDELSALATDLALLSWVGFPLLGLVLIEQIFRNSDLEERWAIRYLCIGLGGVFAFDFFMFAHALLFKQLQLDLWNARGFVSALGAPLVAISIARNPVWELGIHVSRHVVFHSAALFGAGIYLIFMALAGYLIRFYGGTWGGVLQALFLAGSGVLLLVLLFSDRIRARARVLLSKHFFSYKYDYREEWSKFTETLEQGEDAVPERLVRAMAALVHSPGGMIIKRGDRERFIFLASMNMARPEVQPDGSLDSLFSFIDRTHWIVDLREFNSEPGLYEGLALPSWLTADSDAWLIVPLLFHDQVLGVVIMRSSPLQGSVNWEDRDLLKIAGQQAASHLAQYEANLELVNARQFEAFNRLSAYVVHDLKNILAQQSLIVANAKRHRDNPEFVDDVIRTVENSVARMTRLMEQMRSGSRADRPQTVELAGLLKEVVNRFRESEPRPQLSEFGGELPVEADREQLGTVFGHIIQNAIEATEKSGRVGVACSVETGKIHVCISDTGSGMDESFMRQRLFKPFDSTKGLTGMGVGAFESREYIRSIDGDIVATSEVGVGSTFEITLPLSGSGV
jgi:putative PEP-CTERM system histidine kinase